MVNSTQIRLKSRPESVPEISDFECVHAQIPEPKMGELLCATEYLSLDPYMRGQISGRHISGAINPGDMMGGETVSRVVKSMHGDFKKGDYVRHFGGWQSRSIAKAAEVQKIDGRIHPKSLALGALGMPGLTAYAGLMHLAVPKEGDIVLVSAASGAVGSMVGQIAKIHGCQVIGIAGQQRKIDWLLDVAGFDHCINYKTDNVEAALQKLCPDGVNIYFDNVGGDILEAAMHNLALGARVILCGLMAQYNTDTPPPGPNPAWIIKARALVKGLVVYDHFDKQTTFLNKATGWMKSGQIKTVEDISEGLENAPAAFCALMRGENFGKTIVRI